MKFINRLITLKDKLENDKPITKEDLQKAYTLQAIDLVLIGDQFVNDTLKFNEEQDNNVREFLNE